MWNRPLKNYYFPFELLKPETMRRSNKSVKEIPMNSACCGNKLVLVIPGIVLVSRM
jgi:hypothetical protein